MKLLIIFAIPQSLFWPPGDMKKCKFLLSTENHILFDTKSLFDSMAKKNNLWEEHLFSFSLQNNN